MLGEAEFKQTVELQLIVAEGVGVTLTVSVKLLVIEQPVAALFGDSHVVLE